VLRTKVAIIGAGPAGLLLGQLLHTYGVDNLILERHTGEYVLDRIRAGLLEEGTVALLDEVGAGSRAHAEGLVHEGIELAFGGRRLRIDLKGATGKTVMIYGQTEVTLDLMNARRDAGLASIYEAADVTPLDFDTDHPRVSYVKDGATHEIACDFIAGCDGFHGVTRQAIPHAVLREHELVYPFSWLGILAAAPPSTDELIYAWHDRGFALYTMRSPTVSRLYLQVPNDEPLTAWPDERIWQELQIRLASEGWRVTEGEILDRGVTPMRSFVTEPLRYGRLLLAGDAAHIVPPTGAKGLNLAVNDIRLMAAALCAHYAGGADALLDGYSDAALRRVWRAQEFSNYMTMLLHRVEGDFDRALQRARLDYVWRSEAAAHSLAENYAGLPATADF
jgi:p-hydroxybenzoate 3-monooxygenase